MLNCYTLFTFTSLHSSNTSLFGPAWVYPPIGDDRSVNTGRPERRLLHDVQAT